MNTCGYCQRCGMVRAILASLILWPLYIGVSLVLQAVGLVLLLPLAALRLWNVRPSRVYDREGTPLGANWRTAEQLPAWVAAWRGGWLTWLWGNEEDGVTGPAWWVLRTLPAGRQSRFWVAWSSYRWSALRNPVNNLRFVPWINPVIAPASIRSWEWRPWAPGYAQTRLEGATFTWQGLYAGLRLTFHIRQHGFFRFWLGWKLKPEDAHGVRDDDMRKPRCGFAMQFKRVG